jgi:hypothetical protein
MSDTFRRFTFPITFILAGAVFVSVRVPLLVEAYTADAVGDVGGTAPWLLRSIALVALVYAAAAVPAILLARDGVRVWWLPSVVFLLLGTPVERWLGYDSLVVRSAGSFTSMPVDLAAVLVPALILARAAGVERRAIGRDRLLAAAIVLAAYLSWLLPRSMESADPTAGSVALIFLFAVCWRLEGLWRHVTFVGVAFAASKLVAYLIFEGPLAIGAGFHVSLDLVAITVGGLLLTPIASVIERGTARARVARA